MVKEISQVFDAAKILFRLIAPNLTSKSRSFVALHFILVVRLISRFYPALIVLQFPHAPHPIQVARLAQRPRELFSPGFWRCSSPCCWLALVEIAHAARRPAKSQVHREPVEPPSPPRQVVPAPATVQTDPEPGRREPVRGRARSKNTFEARS